MKKIYLFLAAAILTFRGQAQTIPCANMETWVNSNESGSNYLIPQGWVTSDQLQNAFTPTYTGTSTVRSTSVHGGTYAAMLQTVVQGTDTVNGAIITSPSLTSFISAVFGGGQALGFPYATRSANLTGWYKCTVVGGDTVAIGVGMTKWNSSLGQRDTLAEVNMYFSASANSYTQFSIPISYSLNLVPDTAAIAIGINGPNGNASHVGTQFFVDDLAFSGTVPIGVKELQADHDLVRLYPNPVSESATIELNTALSLDDARVVIYDILGNEARVLTNLNSYMLTLDRDGLQSGLYMYRLLIGNGVLAGGKFVVE